jgi:hypothetical protein
LKLIEKMSFYLISEPTRDQFQKLVQFLELIPCDWAMMRTFQFIPLTRVSRDSVSAAKRMECCDKFNELFFSMQKNSSFGYNGTTTIGYSGNIIKHRRNECFID